MLNDSFRDWTFLMLKDIKVFPGSLIRSYFTRKVTCYRHDLDTMWILGTGPDIIFYTSFFDRNILIINHSEFCKQ